MRGVLNEKLKKSVREYNFRSLANGGDIRDLVAN